MGCTKRQFSDLGYWTICPILRKKKARPSEGNLLGITSFAPEAFAIVFLYFSRQQKHTNLQWHYCHYYLFSFYREVAGGGSGNLHRFQYKTSLAK